MVRALTRREQTELDILGVTVVASASSGCEGGCGTCSTGTSGDRDGTPTDRNTCASFGVGKTLSRSTLPIATGIERRWAWEEHTAGRRRPVKDPATGLTDPDAEDNALDEAYEDWFGESATDELTWDCPPPASCGDAPIGLTRSVDDLRPSMDGFVMDGTWPGCLAEIIEMAIALLKANLDLVEWALCTARPDRRGEPGSADCVLERIRGDRTNDVHLALTSDCVSNNGGFGMITSDPHGIFGAGLIRICDAWDGKYAYAERAYCELGDEASRTCAIIAYASSLLHEITHTCGFVHPEYDYGPYWGAPYPCTVPYLVGNNFMTAILDRYPAASASACCGDLIARRIGNSTSLPRTSGDCLPDYPEPPHNPPPPIDGFNPPVGPIRTRIYIDSSDWVVILDGANLTGPL